MKRKMTEERALLMNEMEVVLGEEEGMMQKKVKMSKPVPDREFEYSKDNFEMTTASTSTLENMISVMKQAGDETGSVKFMPTCIEFFCLDCSKTTGIRARISKQDFNKYLCSSIVHTSLNFTTFSKCLGNVQLHKPATITIKSDQGDLRIVGKMDDGRVCIEQRIKALSDDVEEPDFDKLQYDAPVTLDSVKVARAIKCMPATFVISFDGEKGCIRLKGESNQGEVNVPIYFDNDSLVRKLKKNDEIKDYSSTFTKNKLDTLVKATKMSNQVTLGMRTDYPLFARFQITDPIEAENGDEEGSKIDLFFAETISE